MNNSINGPNRRVNFDNNDENKQRSTSVRIKPEVSGKDDEFIHTTYD